MEFLMHPLIFATTLIFVSAAIFVGVTWHEDWHKEAVHDTMSVAGLVLAFVAVTHTLATAMKDMRK